MFLGKLLFVYSFVRSRINFLNLQINILLKKTYNVTKYQEIDFKSNFKF